MCCWAGIIIGGFLLGIIPCDASVLKEEETKNLPFSSSASDSTVQSVSSGTLDERLAFRALSTDQFWGISNAALEGLFSSSTDLICIINYGDKLIRINKRWQEMLGYEAEELLSVPYEQLLHPKDIIKTHAYEKDFTSAGLVNRYRCKHGLYRWLDWIGIPNISRDSTCNYRFAIARDVTIQKMYEKEIGKKIKTRLDHKWLSKTMILEAIAAIQTVQLGELMEAAGSENNARTLKVALQNFIHLTQSNFGFIGEIFKDSRNDVFMQQYWETNPTSSKEAQTYYAMHNSTCVPERDFAPFLKRVIQEKEAFKFNTVEEAFPEAPIPEAYQYVKQFLVLPLLNQNELMGIVGLSNDNDLNKITGIPNFSGDYKKDILEWLQPLILLASRIATDSKRERLRKEIENEHKERLRAEEASRVKTLFIAHMSHEIRTPLSVIIGNLDLINKKPLSSNALQQVQNIEVSAHTLLQISNDIIDVGKLEAGAFKLEKKEFDLKKIIQETINLLLPESNAKGLKFNLTLALDLPEIVKGDPILLRQIIFNLVGNAIKYTSQGSINTVFKGEASPTNKYGFILSGEIKDTGIGIKEDVIPTLFKPFIQGIGIGDREFGGIGLGLYITRQICQAMGGEVNLNSKRGEGSTFSFKVNLRYPKIAPSPDLIIKTSKEFPHLRILMADDNIMIQKLFKSILDKLGCESTIVSNGREAWEAVQNNTYDLVLMDGEMPEMNGLDATIKIREQFDLETLPIIGVTAHALATDRNRFMAAGMNRYLIKPVKLVDLKAEMLRYVMPNLLKKKT